MIIVKPTSNQTKIKLTGLHQWDYLRTLQFKDPYPIDTEVHFANSDMTDAMVYLLKDGKVSIPNTLLTKTLPIMVWVYVNGKTVLEIIMPVNARAKPDNYISVPDEDKHDFVPRIVSLEEWQIESIKQMTERYTKEEVDSLLNAKANVGISYTKTEADNKFNLKADVNTVENGLSNRYTKQEADSKFDMKADVDIVQNELDARYTKAETDSLLAGKVDNVDIQVINSNMEKIDTALVEIKSASQNMNFKYETSNANLVPSDLVIAVFPLLPTNQPVMIDINRNGFHIFVQGMKTSANSGFFISGSSNHKAMQHQCHAGTWTHTAL